MWLRIPRTSQLHFVVGGCSVCCGETTGSYDNGRESCYNVTCTYSYDSSRVAVYGVLDDEAP